MGDMFFLQIPSVEQWLNSSILVEPISFTISRRDEVLFMIRIYTTLYGIGRIRINNVNIDANRYHRISSHTDDYYYYESVMSTKQMHRISPIDSKVIYSVRQRVYSQSDITSSFAE
jgi:hypothetical protein